MRFKHVHKLTKTRLQWEDKSSAYGKLENSKHMLQENNLKYGRIGRDLLSFTVSEKEYTKRNVVF